MSAILAPGDIEPAAELLKSLANPQRLLIVCALIEGERSVADLERTLEIRQPSLSQHLASLRDTGIIAARREAKFVFYRLNDGRASRIVETLHGIFGKQTAKPKRRGNEEAARPPQHTPSPQPKSSRRVPAEAAMFARIGE